MLLQLLQEASNLSISEVKKAIQKDKRASQVLKKGLKLSDIENPEAFLTTLKYYIFNNDNVRNFVEMRNNVRDIDVPEFKRWRALRASDLTEQNIEWITEFVQNLFKEHAYVERGSMSAELKRQLNDWINSNNRYHNLSPWAQKELMALPHLRPDKRVLVYRGVLFKEYDLKTEKKYDGTMEEGNGIKFLKSIKQGGREVDLTWDRPSSWTVSKGTAQQFAMYGPASSNYAATLQWLDRSMKQQAIDGALGFVISTFAHPEDILIDTRRLMSGGVRSQHGDEGEIILKAGTYTARIVKKYTVKGEVDPEAVETHDTEKLHKALSAADDHVSKMKVPSELGDLTDIQGAGWHIYDATQIVKDMPKFRKLALDSTTTQVMHEYDKLVDFYNKELHHLEDDDIRADSLIGKEDLKKRADSLKTFLRTLRGEIRHRKFAEANPTKVKGKIHDLSAEEFRATIIPTDLKYLESDLLVKGRIFDKINNSPIETLAAAVGVKPPSTHLHMLGNAKQQPFLEEVFSKLLDKLGVEPSDDYKENVKRALNLLKKAYRNHKMIETLKAAQKSLKGNKDED
jgi:hypothetical protein